MKLFLFAIGGTGSRVLRSLCMLAAAGVKIPVDSIVPIIVDPDTSNSDLTDVVSLMDEYSRIRETQNFNAVQNNEFFFTDIEDKVQHFRLPISNTANVKFKDFIQYGSLSKANQAFVSMLFSEENLESDMTVGFKGNPNIGSVVLNQFFNSEEFLNFANSFQDGDRIFIISSIFGGTGASGFPLLLKILRNLPNTVPNYDSIRNSSIGAITVLPYFQVKYDPSSPIDSSTFIGKTKAALEYYAENITGNDSLDRMYYIGDSENIPQYSNHDGGQAQKNPANFIEFAASLSVIDFVNMPSPLDGEPRHTDIYEFGIKNYVPGKNLVFSSLYDDYSDKEEGLLYVPMTQFVLFAKYMSEHYSEAKNQPWRKQVKVGGPFAMKLEDFSSRYLNWLKEMAESGDFAPFEISKSGRDLYDVVADRKPNKWFNVSIMCKYGYDMFDNLLNGCQLNRQISPEQQMLELFYKVTKEIVNKKL